MPQYVGHLPEPFINSSDLQGENTAVYVMDCDRKAVCATGDDQNTSLFSYKIDTDSLVYINNWVESLNM